MSRDPYRSPERCEVLPPGAYRIKGGVQVGASKLWGDRSEDEVWEHWSWVSGISRARYEELVAAEREVEHLKKELAALMSPGIIEGMRRACLLRKNASAEEVLEHLKEVSASYEYHMTKEQSRAVDKALLSSVERVASFEVE